MEKKRVDQNLEEEEQRKLELRKREVETSFNRRQEVKCSENFTCKKCNTRYEFSGSYDFIGHIYGIETTKFISKKRIIKYVFKINKEMECKNCDNIIILTN